MLLFLLLTEGKARRLVPCSERPGQAGRIRGGHARGVPGSRGRAAAAVAVAFGAVKGLAEGAVFAGAHIWELGLPFHTGTENTPFLL